MADKKDKKRYPHSMGKPPGMSETEYAKTLSKRQQKLRYGPLVGKSTADQRKKAAQIGKEKTQKTRKKIKNFIKKVADALYKSATVKVDVAKKMMGDKNKKK